MVGLRLASILVLPEVHRCPDISLFVMLPREILSTYNATYATHKTLHSADSWLEIVKVNVELRNIYRVKRWANELESSVSGYRRLSR